MFSNQVPHGAEAGKLGMYGWNGHLKKTWGIAAEIGCIVNHGMCGMEAVLLKNQW